MLGKLIEDNETKELLFLCINRTIATVNNSLLIKLCSSFTRPEKITGRRGHWTEQFEEKNEESIKARAVLMENVRPDDIVIAYISDDYKLVVTEPNIFNSILAVNEPKFYMSVTQFAKKHGCSKTYIKNLCNDKRLPGARKVGEFWIIPSYAPYPPQPKRNYPDYESWEE